MSDADSRRGRRIVAMLSLFVTAGLGPDFPALAGIKDASTEISPPCIVTVQRQVESPFVPDGRQSLAEISFRVLFPSVTFEFDPKEDPLLGRCQVNSDKGKGVFSRLALNDVQKGKERLSPRFLRARPKEFSAGLAVESEPTAEDEAAAKSRTAPEKVRLSFWTEWESMAIYWGSEFGSASLPEFRTVFEVPFHDLIQGRTFSVTFPYEGRYPEDKGTWSVNIRPAAVSKQTRSTRRSV